MKKSYKKPQIKEITPDFGRLEKGSDGEYRLIHTQHHPYFDPYLGMTPEEVRVHVDKIQQKVFLSSIPTDGDRDKLKEIFDNKLNDLKKKYPGCNKALVIKKLERELTENKHDPLDQIKADIFLQFLEEQEKRISESIIDSDRPDSEYTVKSIILAYCYMHKKGIYPIIELSKSDFILKEVHDKYGHSADSFRNDWNPIFKEKTKRLAWAPNIELAIKLLETNYSAHPGISKSIKLAKEELQEAKLKS